MKEGINETVAIVQGTPVDLDESANSSTNGSTPSDSRLYGTSSHNSGGGGDGILPEQRMAALTRTMGEKQREISEEFCKLIKKISKYVHQAETDDSLDIDASFIRKRKIEGITEHASHMVKKQDCITRQFEALVSRLEHDNVQKERTNQKLNHRLQLAQLLLKEHGIDFKNEDEDLSETNSTLDLTNSESGGSSERNHHRSKSKLEKSERCHNNTPLKSDHKHSNYHPHNILQSQRKHNKYNNQDIFSIKEISIKIDENFYTNNNNAISSSSQCPIITPTMFLTEMDNNNNNTTSQPLDQDGGTMNEQDGNNLCTNIVNNSNVVVGSITRDDDDDDDDDGQSDATNIDHDPIFPIEYMDRISI